MRCYRCGKDVPFFGVDCQHCGSDKSQAQALHCLGVVCAGAGLGVGMALGGLVGLLVGGMLGGVVCIVALSMANQGPEERHFPRQRRGV